MRFDGSFGQEIDNKTGDQRPTRLWHYSVWPPTKELLLLSNKPLVILAGKEVEQGKVCDSPLVKQPMVGLVAGSISHSG